MLPEATTRTWQSWGWNSGCPAPDSTLFTLNCPAPRRMDIIILESSSGGCCEVPPSRHVRGQCSKLSTLSHRWCVLSLPESSLLRES